MISSLVLSAELDRFHHFFSEEGPQRNAYAGPLFILPTSGQALVEVDGRSYTLKQGVLLTLLPHHLACTRVEEADFRCLTLAFTFDSMTDFPYMLPSCISEKMERDPVLELPAADWDRLTALFDSIAAHHRRLPHPSYTEILRSFLFIFTAEVSALYSARPLKVSASHAEELTEGFFRLLHAQVRLHREPAFYASQLCITPKYLSRIISQITGQVPSQWIANFTIMEAKMLLKSTTLTVTQLSEQLNFPNSSFFARYFKRYVGMTPIVYRQSGLRMDRR